MYFYNIKIEKIKCLGSRMRFAWLKVALGGLLLLALCSCGSSSDPTPTATIEVPADTPTPAPTTETPTPASSESPRTQVYWKSDRLQHNNNDLIEVDWAENVVLRDFEVEATFVNPYPTETGPWNVGFFFRDEGGNQNFRLVIGSDKTWQLLNYSGTTEGLPINEGILPALNISPDGSNHLRFIANENRGELYVNNEFVANLDLSARTNAGYIRVGTGFFAGTEIEGEVTRYRDFIIRVNDTPATVTAQAASLQATATAQASPALVTPVATPESDIRTRYEPIRSQVYGKGSGQLEHNDDGLLQADFVDVQLRNFWLEATFANPYPTESGTWDAGFLFRFAEANEEFRLIIRSDKKWSLDNRSENQSTQIAQGTIPILNTSPDGSNLIALIADETRGYLFINNQFVAELDLSVRTNAGQIGIATGFFDDAEINGKVTHYQHFTIWSIDETSSAPEATVAATDVSQNLPNEFNTLAEVDEINSYRQRIFILAEGDAFAHEENVALFAGGVTLLSEIVKEPPAERLLFTVADVGDIEFIQVDSQAYGSIGGLWTESSPEEAPNLDELTFITPEELGDDIQRLEQVGTQTLSGRKTIHYRGDKQTLNSLNSDGAGFDFNNTQEARLDLWIDQQAGFIVRMEVIAEGKGLSNELPNVEGRIELTFEYYDFNDEIVIEAPNITLD